jgi:oligopeptide transport system substrate-binding protein
MIAAGHSRTQFWTFVVFGLVTACGKPLPVEEPVTPPLRIVMAEPASLDPAYLLNAQDFQIAGNLFEGLYRWDGTKGQVVPCLAAAHLASDNGLIWTFSIIPTARFSDGTPITARHIEMSWRRILAPTNASPGADALLFLKGARKHIQDGTSPIGVRAPDATTLVIELETPQPHLLEMLASPRLAPALVPRDARQDQSRTGTIRGNGPFVLQHWHQGESAVLAPNALYLPPPPAEVHLRFTQSEDNALDLFKGGQADLVVGLVPLSLVHEIQRDHPGSVVIRPRRSVFYLLFNTTRPPFHRAEVRRTMAKAVDRGRLAEQVLMAGQMPSQGFLPASYVEIPPAHPLVCPELPDVPVAAPSGLLAEVEGMELLCNESETLKSVMEFLQAGFKQYGGVSLGLSLFEWNTYYEFLKQGDFALARMSYTSGSDPLDLLMNFTTGHPNNLGRYSNPEYDRNVEELQRVPRLEDRLPLLMEAHSLLCADMPAIPVYVSSQVTLVAPERRSRFRPDHEGNFRMEELWPGKGRK